MGWAHDGAVTSSAVKTATMTRAGGLGGEELESATACCVDAVPGLAAVAPGPSSEVPEPASTAIFLEPSVRILVPSAGALESDPASSGGAGTKMESDSGEGLIDGLRRR